MEQFKKKPVVIEAIQYNGTNQHDIIKWVHTGLHPISNSIATYDGAFLHIRTLKGDMVANIGDWIIKGVKGEFYPCKLDVFEQSYEAVATTNNVESSPRQVETLVMPPTLAEITQRREYRTVHKLIETLASICAGSDKVIIEKLTGYLWDEEEAGKIKAA